MLDTFSCQGSNRSDVSFGKLRYIRCNGISGDVAKYSSPGSQYRMFRFFSRPFIARGFAGDVLCIFQYEIRFGCVYFIQERSMGIKHLSPCAQLIAGQVRVRE